MPRTLASFGIGTLASTVARPCAGTAAIIAGLIIIVALTTRVDRPPWSIGGRWTSRAQPMLRADARGGLGGLSPLRQALGDDPGRLQGGLRQGRIFDDLAFDARALALQRLAQDLELDDDIVEGLDRVARHPTQQKAETVLHDVAILLRLPPPRRKLAAAELAGLRCRPRRSVELGGLERPEEFHVSIAPVLRLREALPPP